MPPARARSVLARRRGPDAADKLRMHLQRQIARNLLVNTFFEFLVARNLLVNTFFEFLFGHGWPFGVLLSAAIVSICAALAPPGEYTRRPGRDRPLIGAHTAGFEALGP